MLLLQLLGNACLARSAKLPEGLYFSLFFNMSKAISVSTGPIFTIFLPNGRYLREFSWSGPVFAIPQGTLPWHPIKVEKLAFLRTNLFVVLPFGNGLQYRNSDFKRLDRMNISTSCAVLVTFCPETSVYAVNNSTFCGDMAKISISRPISQNILDLPWPTLQVW